MFGMETGMIRTTKIEEMKRKVKYHKKNEVINMIGPEIEYARGKLLEMERKVRK